MKKEITQSEYLQLTGLLHLGQLVVKKAVDIETAMREIVGEDDKWGGHCADALWGEYSAEELLDKLDLKVPR